MPGALSYTYCNESPRIAAWAAHYEAKGCHPVKARDVARQKVSRSRTWPVTPSHGREGAE